MYLHESEGSVRTMCTPVYKTLTQYFANGCGYVYVLHVAECHCVEKSEGGVRFEGHPHPITKDNHLIDFCFLVSIDSDGSLCKGRS